VKSGVRWSKAGGRVWELKGFLRCECGKIMMAHPISKKRYYYLCRERRERYRVGTHAPYINAVHAERQVREAILDLVSKPEVMLERVREQIERKRAHRANIDRERAAWHEELQKIELRRDAFIEMRADGDLSKEKFREKLAALDARKATAEGELEALEAEPVEDLDLLEEYIRELPALIHGPEIPVRPYETIDPEETGEEFVFQEITPDMFRERTDEEIEELRRQKERERSKRYRATYQDLQLNVIAHEDRTLEIVAPLRLKLEKRSKNSGRGWW
jgi:Recombinase zinc beta ribbon domain